MAKRYIITPQGELREIETTPDSQALAQAMAIFNESRRTDAEVLTQAAVRGLHRADTMYKFAGQRREHIAERQNLLNRQFEYGLMRLQYDKDKGDIEKIFDLLGILENVPKKEKK